MKKEHISDFMLERYLLGELPGKKKKLLDSLFTEDADLKQRVGLLKESDTDIRQKYPEEEIIFEIKRRYELRSSGNKIKKANKPVFRKVLLPSFALGLAAVALFFALPAIKMNFIKDDIIIHKGSPQIYIYRKGDAEPLQNGSYARKGDLLQIAYQTDAEAFGIILSIDGRGTVTLHFPDNASGSTKLTLNEKTALGNSYELDDAPEFERFFFITSESPLNTKSILRAAEELARNKFNVLNENIKITGITDNSIRQMSITIKK